MSSFVYVEKMYFPRICIVAYNYCQEGNVPVRCVMDVTMGQRLCNIFRVSV